MTDPTFEWDSAKAAVNLEKHGISFESATTVFQDPLAVIHPDPDHSESEHREIIVGHTDTDVLLLVAFTERGGTIRLISARKATKAERKTYEENRQ